MYSRNLNWHDSTRVSLLAELQGLTLHPVTVLQWWTHPLLLSPLQDSPPSLGVWHRTGWKKTSWHTWEVPEDKQITWLVPPGLFSTSTLASTLVRSGYLRNLCTGTFRRSLRRNRCRDCSWQLWRIRQVSFLEANCFAYSHNHINTKSHTSCHGRIRMNLILK